MSDWLGNGRTRRGNWRPFDKARAFVQGLRLKSASDWRAYCGSGKKPNDVPSNPNTMYADAGWDGWSDWLGSGGDRRGNWRPFEEARAFVRKLGLKSSSEWFAYCRSGKKPDDIPVTPHSVYADADWASMSDWLGNGDRRGNWRPFEEARAFVRSLGLESRADWKTYCRSGKKPDDIPTAPANVYTDAGWDGWGDWLG
jgi:3-mercaptopyruvate sulfurtransferase SseA